MNAGEPESTSRRLGHAETLFWFLGQANCGNGAIFAEVDGELDAERLQQAVLNAQRRHPFLRARVRRKGLSMIVETEAQGVLSLDMTYAAKALSPERCERIASRLHATLLSNGEGVGRDQ